MTFGEWFYKQLEAGKLQLGDQDKAQLSWEAGIESTIVRPSKCACGEPAIKGSEWCGYCKPRVEAAVRRAVNGVYGDKQNNN